MIKLDKTVWAFRKKDGTLQKKHNPLVFLVYLSQIQCDEDGMERMLQASRRNNLNTDITGLLIRDRRNFLQILEGPATAVGLAMLRIASDPRHSHMALMASQQVEMRLFSNWSMGMAEFTDRRSTIARKMDPIARLSPLDRADWLRRFALSFEDPDQHPSQKQMLYCESPRTRILTG